MAAQAPILSSITPRQTRQVLTMLFNSLDIGPRGRIAPLLDEQSVAAIAESAGKAAANGQVSSPFGKALLLVEEIERAVPKTPADWPDSLASVFDHACTHLPNRAIASVLGANENPKSTGYYNG